jgi:hypothetical protein
VDPISGQNPGYYAQVNLPNSQGKAVRTIEIIRKHGESVADF